MKKILAATAALFMATGLFAQDWEQVKKLYQAGMYSESVRLVQGNNSPMAEGYRALCALQLRSDNAYELANAFVEKNHEHILVPQVRFLLALDYFDHERYEDALVQFAPKACWSVCATCPIQTIRPRPIIRWAI